MRVRGDICTVKLNSWLNPTLGKAVGLLGIEKKYQSGSGRIQIERCSKMLKDVPCHIFCSIRQFAATRHVCYEN